MFCPEWGSCVNPRACEKGFPCPPNPNKRDGK